MWHSHWNAHCSKENRHTIDISSWLGIYIRSFEFLHFYHSTTYKWILRVCWTLCNEVFGTLCPLVIRNVQNLISLRLFLLVLMSNVSSGSICCFHLPNLHFIFGYWLRSCPVYFSRLLEYRSIYSADIQVVLLRFINGDAKSLGIFLCDCQAILKWTHLVLLRILLSCSPSRYKNRLQAYKLLSPLNLSFWRVTGRVT